MLRHATTWVLFASLFAMSSCCCLCRGDHSIRKFWLDYNTLDCPAIYVEQVDHLPYPAGQVGYYRWMYDKDPGHQLAGLNPPVVKAAPAPAMPGPDEPFGYQILYPAGVPNQTDQLWSTKTPEPVNLPKGAFGDLWTAPKTEGPNLAPPATSTGPSPILPPAPPSVNAMSPSTPSRTTSPNGMSPAPQGVQPPAQTPGRLPLFDDPKPGLPAPQSKPAEEMGPPPPGAFQNPASLRLMNQQSSANSPAPDLP